MIEPFGRVSPALSLSQSNSNRKTNIELAWEKAISIPRGVAFVCPENGFIVASIRVNNTTYSYFTINISVSPS